jgi:hypothetical protein
LLAAKIGGISRDSCKAKEVVMSEETRPQPIQQFKETFAWLDESIIVEELKQRKDVIDALNAKGTIKVKVEFSEKPFWHSKKFWGGGVALIILVIDQFTATSLWTVALPAMVYVFGQGLADLGKNKPTPPTAP